MQHIHDQSDMVLEIFGRMSHSSSGECQGGSASRCPAVDQNMKVVSKESHSLLPREEVKG